MTVEIKPLAPDALEVSVKDVLTTQDYATFVPIAEERIREYGHVNFLIHLDELRGASPPALWDLKFDERDLAVAREWVSARSRSDG